ncbi:hypothetical protein K439DRAFT_1630288 [Ramaria rubella]|nr:hypothetical protein K439DRAFT_1630288 [Ramaria rubella]
MLPLYINPATVDDAGEDNKRKRTGLTSCPCCKGVSGSSHLPRISCCTLDIEGGLDETIGALEFHLWPNTQPSNDGISNCLSWDTRPCAANPLIGEEAGMATMMGIQNLHDPGSPQ